MKALRSHNCGEINQSLIGQVITVAGWAQRRRDHGGVIFIDLRMFGKLSELDFCDQGHCVAKSRYSSRSILSANQDFSTFFISYC